MNTRASERHVASKALALDEIENVLRREFEGKGEPVPSPQELRRLAEERFALVPKIAS